MFFPHQLWPFLRRDLRGGWAAAYHATKTLPLIEDWTWTFWGETLHTVPVHVLTGAKDWRLAAWMLASWFHYTQTGWPVVIHDDGTLPTQGRETLERLFDSIRFISRGEADNKINARLKGFPLCQQYRIDVPRAVKLFDLPEFTTGEKFLSFDSDLLFFSNPREIRAWADSPTLECWFNEGARENLLLPPRRCEELFEVTPWMRVDTGLGLLCKAAFNLELCERALGETAISHGDARSVEQTLWALCAGRHGEGGLLSKRYEVSLGRHAASDAISRHYAGSTRDYIFSEGIRRLDWPLLGEEPD